VGVGGGRRRWAAEVGGGGFSARGAAISSLVFQPARLHLRAGFQWCWWPPGQVLATVRTSGRGED
jgi:hypothetical protein